MTQRKDPTIDIDPNSVRNHAQGDAHRVLAELGYNLLDELKIGKVFLCARDESDQRFILRRSSGATTAQNFGRIRDAFEKRQEEFRLLYIPRRLGTAGDFDIFEYVEGSLYPWSEDGASPHFGGRSIPLSLVDTAVSLSQDLDTLGVLTDFYWRNFVFMADGRVGVIDWEHVIPCNRSSERLAYLYCLMFSNEAWQRHLVTEARRRGILEYETFRKDILNRATLFRAQWSQKTEIRMQQERIIENASSAYKYNALWHGLDLGALLNKSKYQVFDDLGQEKSLTSQIDCAGKLSRLGIEKYDLSGRRLLDVGCNAGWFLKEYAKRGAGPLVGIDTEKVWCDLAETLLKFVYSIEDVQIINSGFIEYDGHGFDIITATSMLHYLPDKQGFFMHASGLINPGGLLIVEIPIHGKNEDTIVLDMEPKRYIPSRGHLERAATNAGFELAYFGMSNLSDRRVFHFLKK